MAYEPQPIERIGERRGQAPAVEPAPSPFGTDRFDRAQLRPGGWTPGDWLSLSGAAAARMEPLSGVVAADTAHLGVHGRDLARIARGEITYEAYLARQQV